MSSTMVLMILSSLEDGDMTKGELYQSIPESWRDDWFEESLDDAYESGYTRKVIVNLESKYRITDEGRKYLEKARSESPRIPS